MKPLKKSYLNLSLIILILTTKKCCSEDVITVPNVKLRFTSGTTMGIFVALAFPIDLPERNVYYSHFFEAIHYLPTNQTSFEYPPLIERNMDRQMAYKVFEKKIQSNGFPGRSCLLRTICEISQSSIREINGLLGEIIHIIFTPSTSKNFGLSSEYISAEKKGRNHDCATYSKSCGVSFVDLITQIEDSVDD